VRCVCTFCWHALSNVLEMGKFVCNQSLAMSGQSPHKESHVVFVLDQIIISVSSGFRNKSRSAQILSVCV
jgi:hypothetical protein